MSIGLQVIEKWHAFDKNLNFCNSKLMDSFEHSVHHNVMYKIDEGLTLYHQVCMGSKVQNDAQKWLQIFKQQQPRRVRCYYVSE